MKRKHFTILMGGLTCLLGGILIAGNILAFKTYSSFLTTQFGMEGAGITNFNTNQYFLRELSSQEEAYQKLIDVSERTVEEGTILLKNEEVNGEKVLPLKTNSRVSLFSQSSIDFVHSSKGGSGGSTETDNSLEKALNNVGIEVNPTLIDFYRDMNYRRKVGGLQQGTSKDPFLWGINEVPYSKYTDKVKNSYKEYNDAAIVVISRVGAENADLPTDMASADSRNQRGSTSILELDIDEKELIENVRKEFSKVIVILNVSNAFECGFLDEYDIDACLWLGADGSYGLEALARVIAGKVNPSGGLTDTYAYDVFSSPAMQNFGNFAYIDSQGNETGHHYVTYSEGIYVGYKYYETRYEDYMLSQGNAGNYIYDDIVQFPFGYGLSYTDFTWSNFNVEKITKSEKIFVDYGNEITKDIDYFKITVNVKNTGDIAGKDIVQFYAQSPYTDYDKENNVEKASVQLVDFAKTSLLDPGDEEILTIEVPIERLKSYDEHGRGTYILESGDYYLTASSNSHEAINNILKAKEDEGTTLIETLEEGRKDFVKKMTLDENDYDFSKDTRTDVTITNQFEDDDGGKKYLSRQNWSIMDNNGLRDGTNPNNRYDNDGYIYQNEITPKLQEELEKIGYVAAYAPEETFEEPTYSKKGDKTLIDLRNKPFDDPEWQELLDQVRLQEAEQMVSQSGHKTYGMSSINKPYATDADGTQGWKSFIGDGVAVNGLPSEPVQAATFNKELAYEIGNIMGELALWAKITNGTATNLTGWYGPAMNIHRTPFGGRNFEYYSEDAYLSGIIGSEVVKGGTDKGLITYIKHFAFNDQETNRMTDNVVWSNEQALREIYLTPFEMAIKEGNSLGLMTAYNRIGTTWVGGSYNLLTNVLRKEWGFNGFVISDYMDGDYENCDQMIAAGGDAALCLEDQPVSKDTSQAKTYLRRAVHHMLYAFVNSNGMNGIDSSSIISNGTPIYYRYMIVIDIALGLSFILCLSLTIYSLFALFKEKKLVTQNNLTVSEAHNKTKIPNKLKLIIGGALVVSIVASTLITLLTIKTDETEPINSIEPLENLVDPNTDLNEKYGLITKRYLKPGFTYSENNEVKMTYDSEALGYYYEAEDATISSQAGVDASLATSGGKFISHFNPGETITFKIDSTVHDTALVILSTSSWFNQDSKPLTDVLYGQFGTNLDQSATRLEMDLGSRVMTSKNNWDSYSENYIAEVTLYEGTNYIEINAFDSFNIDYMCLVKPGAGLSKPSLEDDPTIYETKYGNPDKRILEDGSSSQEFSYEKRGYYYEAESALLGGNARIEDNKNASGGKVVGKFEGGASMTFTINSDADCLVMLQASGSNWEGSTFELYDILIVKYGNKERLQELNLYNNNATLGNEWTNFKEFIIGEIHLTKGENTIVLISKESVNFDYIKLVNLWDGTEDPHPDSNPDIEDNPVQYLEIYGNPAKTSLTDGTNSKAFSKNQRGYYYEAESSQITGKAQVGENSLASGGKQVDHFEVNSTMTFTINSDSSKKAMLKIAGSNWEGNSHLVRDILNVEYGTDLNNLDTMNLYNNEAILGAQWNNYKEFIVGEISLKEGTNYIKFTSKLSVNYDYISLINEKSEFDDEPVISEDPTDYQTKYGSPSKEDLIDGSSSKLFSNDVRGYYYEAESSVLSGSSIRVENNVSASNGQNVGSFSPNSSMTFTITSNCKQTVMLQASMATWDGETKLVTDIIKVEYGLQDSLVEMNPYNNEVTFGDKWVNFKEGIFGEITLNEGENIIILTSKYSVNYDYIKLVNPIN